MQINFSSGFYHGKEIAATKLPYDSGFEVKFLKDFCCICGLTEAVWFSQSHKVGSDVHNDVLWKHLFEILSYYS
jgi:hypothetical protein